MKIGEILLEHQWVTAATLKRALAEQRDTGKRLCSLLISRGLLDPDQASLALGEQHGVAAVLQRHLDARDQGLSALLSPELARQCHALPIGHNRDGALIVCVRDPLPAIVAALTQTLGDNVIIAVAPASQLERIIDVVYEPLTSESFEIDLSTGPIPSLPPEGPPAKVGTGPLANLGGLTLVELDDARVAKDPSQSDPMISLRAQGRPLAAAPTMRIEEAIDAIANAQTTETAIEIALRYLRVRWTAAMWLSVRDGVALGQRGHGPQLTRDTIEAVAIPLQTSSFLREACEHQRVVTAEPHSSDPSLELLVRLLGQPRSVLAAPLTVGGQVGSVLVVADPLGPGDASLDLARLTTATGTTCEQILRARAGAS